VSTIDKANAKAIDILLGAKPVLKGIGVAGEDIPGMAKNMILHAGPPIEWDRMCGPMRGAVMGALLYERMASSMEEAENIREQMTPEFLLVKLQAQAALADAQRAEIRAIADFNISLTELARTMGTVLELRQVSTALPAISKSNNIPEQADE